MARKTKKNKTGNNNDYYNNGLNKLKLLPFTSFKSEVENSNITSQAEALYYMLRGDNVLLCGQAGTGKSFVIETFCNILDEMNARLEEENKFLKGAHKTLKYAVTASTGIAASLINAVTIHSWSSLRIDVDKPTFDSIKGYKADKKRWNMACSKIKSIDILIIDEISMLPAYFITNLDALMKIACNNDRPFGGKQIIAVGDFLQLPPVDKKEYDSSGNLVDSRMCYYSQAFKDASFKSCYLDVIHRSNDENLTNVLNHIREANVSDHDLEVLNSRCVEKIEKPEGKTFTQLYTKNCNVDYINNGKLKELSGKAYTFTSKCYSFNDFGDKIMDASIKLQKDARIPKELSLKVGAVVMLTANNAEINKLGHVNGSIGKIIDIETSGSCSIYDTVIYVKFNDGLIGKVGVNSAERHVIIPMGSGRDMKYVKSITAKVDYIPLKLAWAITVHKSQGQTLDGAIIDLSNCFQKGLGYVAVSRVRALNDIILASPLDGSELELDEETMRVDEAAKSSAKKSHETLLGELKDNGDAFNEKFKIFENNVELYLLIKDRWEIAHKAHSKSSNSFFD